MARKFQFRLEVVRKLREQARNAQRRAVADAAQAVLRAEQNVERLNEQLRQTVEINRGERESRRIDVAALRVGEFYRNWLHHRIIDGAMRLTEEQARLQAERDNLGQASARLKAIEKFKERRWSSYRHDVAREEQAVTDEAALRTYGKWGDARMMAKPPGMLKRLYDAIALVAVVNVFMLTGFGAYLYATGALDVKKLRQIGLVVRGIPLTAAKPVGPAPSAGVAVPTVAPAETDQEVEIAYRESERIKTELEQRLALSNSILLKVRTEREAFQKEREAAQKKEEAAKVAQQDQGFRKQAEILEALAPKVAVQHLLSMADSDEAARLLMSMDTAKVKKIVEAAKRGDEMTKMKAILQRVREVAPMQLADFNETDR